MKVVKNRLEAVVEPLFVSESYATRFRAAGDTNS